MFKRITAFLLCVLMLACAASCESAESRAFRKEAEAYFDIYRDVREGGRADKTYSYGKNGSYAVELPVTDSAADAEIKQYCDSAVADFQKTAAEGDKLFISYRLHAANGDVGTVVLYDSNGGSHTVHFDKQSEKPMTDDLKRAVMAHARIAGHTPNGEMVFTKDGVRSGDATVSYDKLRPTLPKGIKDTIPDNGRVVDLSKKLVAITYDDGPCKLTDDILDILEQNGSVATFFELGQLIGTQPEAIKRMDKLGCEIASHTWSHKNLTKVSAAEVRSQLDKTDEALMKITGKKTQLMRPPYGAVSKAVRAVCDKPMIGWSVDTLDWQSRNADKVIETVKSAGDLDGQVILMHSLYESTVDATRELVPWLIENGYQLVTVSELFEYKYMEAPEAGKYYTSSYFGN